MSIDKTVCELFAGVGGFHLGLSRSGDWNVIWANQWEPSKKTQSAYDCYVKHFPNTVTLNIDISKVTDPSSDYTIPSHNLLVGGFPCQDYSVASTGAKGIEGKKGVLWWEIYKILESKRTPFVLLENVDRLLKSPAKQRGRDFAIMLAGFRDLGYCVEWRVINAADYGFAQKRKRVFIFAYHNTTNYYKSAYSNFLNNTENYIVDNGFFSEEFAINDISSINTFNLTQDILTISNSFTESFLESGVLINNTVLTHKYTPNYKGPMSLLKDILDKDVDDKYYLGSDLEKWEYLKGAKCENRKTKDGFEYLYREGALSFPDPIDKPSRTILTSESTRSRTTHVVLDPQTNKLRILTPTECEKLNGFDYDWTNTGMSEKYRYFCMGNALVVNLITKMGNTLSNIFDKE